MEMERCIEGLADEPSQRAGTDGLFQLLKNKEWDKATLVAATELGKREAQTPDEFGRLPLHLACCTGAPLRVTEALISANPIGAQRFDSNGCLPIHLCCAETPLSTARAILSAYEKGAKTRDREGCLPIHHSCFCGAPCGIIRMLLNTFEEGAGATDECKKIPLHHALEDMVSNMEEDPHVSEVIHELLAAFPAGARKIDSSGNLPIHIALDGAPLQVVESLLDAFPNSACIPDGEGLLPLTIACGADEAIPEVISAVLQRFPLAAEMPDPYGLTPLLDALLNERPLTVIRNLVEANPNCASVGQMPGCGFPLHVACSVGADLEVIQLLLHAFPRGARLTDEGGRLPLHVEISNQCRLEVIRAILDFFPEGSSVPYNERSWSQVLCTSR